MILIKQASTQTSYYKIVLYRTLFDDFLLVREYGCSENKKPTGIIKKYYLKPIDALKDIAKLVKQQEHKGYTKRIKKQLLAA